MQNEIKFENVKVAGFAYKPGTKSKLAGEDVDPEIALKLVITSPNATLAAEIMRWSEGGEMDITVQIQKKLSMDKMTKDVDEEGKPIKAADRRREEAKAAKSEERLKAAGAKA